MRLSYHVPLYAVPRFTMEGPDVQDPDLQGVIPRMIWSVFDGIYSAPEHIEFLVKISIVELYQERIRDLLDTSKDNLQIREDKEKGIYIADLTEYSRSNVSLVWGRHGVS